MSQTKSDRDEAERALLTLDQLSQTIEVMTAVVERLRRHLSEQLREQTGEDAPTAVDIPRATERLASRPDVYLEIDTVHRCEPKLH